MKRMTTSFRRAAKFGAEDGNVAVILAIVLAGLIVMIGGAIELIRTDSARRAVQAALDTAVLAPVASGLKGDAALADARRVFAQNSGIKDKTDLAFSWDGAVLAGEAKVDFATPMLSVIGLPNIPFTINSAATRRINGIELAIVVDVSGSMSGSIPALRQSMTAMLDYVYDGANSRPDIWVSIIPFSGRVNINNDGPGWFIPGQIPASAAFAQAGNPGYTSNSANTCKYSSYQAARPRLCTARRTGAAQWNDTPPATAPFNLYAGSAETCPVPRAQGLVASRAVVQAVTDNLCAGHGTSTQEGMAWGWRALSPKWRGLWGDPALPLDYDKSPGKVAVIMTDGKNHPGQAGDPLTETQANDELLLTCKAMKDEGIVIFAVTYNMGGALTSLYRQCTSQPDFQYDAEDPAALKAAFADIGGKVSTGEVRLIK